MLPMLRPVQTADIRTNYALISTLTNSTKACTRGFRKADGNCTLWIGNVREWKSGNSSINRYIYSKEGMSQELWWYLPEHRKSRRPRRARKRQVPRFDRDVSILFRPDDVAHRRQFGHWEADLMLFKQKLGQANVTSLVERVSRFIVPLKNPNKRTKPVMGKIMKAVRDLPHCLTSAPLGQI